MLDGYDMLEENERIAALPARYDPPPETPEQTVALDWVSDLVRRLPNFTSRAQLGDAWNTEEAQRHRAYLKAQRAPTLQALVNLVTERRDKLPA